MSETRAVNVAFEWNFSFNLLGKNVTIELETFIFIQEILHCCVDDLRRTIDRNDNEKCNRSTKKLIRYRKFKFATCQNYTSSLMQCRIYECAWIWSCFFLPLRKYGIGHLFIFSNLAGMSLTPVQNLNAIKFNNFLDNSLKLLQLSFYVFEFLFLLQLSHYSHELNEISCKCIIISISTCFEQINLFIKNFLY